MADTAAVTSLKKQLAKATDPADRAQIQKEIDRLGHDATVVTLQAQLNKAVDPGYQQLIQAEIDRQTRASQALLSSQSQFLPPPKPVSAPVVYRGAAPTQE